MKKIFCILFLLCITCKAQVYIVRDNVSQAYNSQTGQYENTSTKDTVLFKPEWLGFKNDITSNPVFLQLLPTANANGYATFIDYINSGIKGENDINKFMLYWNLMGLAPTSSQKDTINAMLTKNFFAIQIQ